MSRAAGAPHRARRPRDPGPRPRCPGAGGALPARAADARARGISDLAWVWRHDGEDTGLFFDTRLVELGGPAGTGHARPAVENPLRERRALWLAAGECRRHAAVRAAGRAVAVTGPSVMGLRPSGCSRGSRRSSRGRRSVRGGCPRTSCSTVSTCSWRQRWAGCCTTSRPTSSSPWRALACEVGEEAPQAPVCRSVLALLDIRDRLAAEPAQGAGWASHQVATALVVAKTPDVAAARAARRVDVGERAPEAGEPSP